MDKAQVLSEILDSSRDPFQRCEQMMALRQHPDLNVDDYRKMIQDPDLLVRMSAAFFCMTRFSQDKPEEVIPVLEESLHNYQTLSERFQKLSFGNFPLIGYIVRAYCFVEDYNRPAAWRALKPLLFGIDEMSKPTGNLPFFLEQIFATTFRNCELPFADDFMLLLEHLEKAKTLETFASSQDVISRFAQWGLPKTQADLQKLIGKLKASENPQAALREHMHAPQVTTIKMTAHHEHVEPPHRLNDFIQAAMAKVAADKQAADPFTYYADDSNKTRPTNEAFPYNLKMSEVPLDFEWETVIGNGIYSTMDDVHAKMHDLLDLMGVDCAYALGVASTEWVIARTEKYNDTTDAKLRVMAARAAQTNPAAATLPKTPSTKGDPATQSWTSSFWFTMRSLRFMHDAYVKGKAVDIRRNAVALIFFADHIAGRSPDFLPWLEESIRRGIKFFPPGEQKNLRFVPKEFFDPRIAWHSGDEAKYEKSFFAGLDRANPYLVA